MTEENINSNTQNKSEEPMHYGVGTQGLPTSGYGVVSIALGALFFLSMVVFAFNAAILKNTNPEGILDNEAIVLILKNYLFTGGPASIIGLIFGIKGIMHEGRSKVLPGWGLFFNFINLNGSLLCLIILASGG